MILLALGICFFVLVFHSDSALVQGVILDENSNSTHSEIKGKVMLYLFMFIHAISHQIRSDEAVQSYLKYIEIFPKIH